MRKNNLRWLALLTITGMGGIAYWLIPVAREVGFMRFLTGHAPLLFQIGVGIITGLVIGIMGWWIISLPFLAEEKAFYAKFVRPLNLNFPDILFISFCAGVGEELLFRGVVQAWFGIWLTSVIFVLMHGYINPFKPKLALYGVFMIISIAFLGLLTEKLGIIAAIVAHMVIDVYLFYKLSKA